MTGYSSLNLAAAPERERSVNVLHAPSRCAECGDSLPASRKRVLFCSPAHRVAWHNRQTVRGRVLTSLVMAARETRDGTRGPVGRPHDVEAMAAGKRAAREATTLMMEWRDEDSAAGRMSQVDYMQRRYELGYEST